MRWGILGPLQITDDEGTEIVVPAGRLRILLAALLTRANHPVPLDELIEIPWDGTPPGDAASTTRVYVSRLRRARPAGSRRSRPCPANWVGQASRRGRRTVAVAPVIAQLLQ